MREGSEGQYPDIMLDIETHGKDAGCVVVSIGAVRFDVQTGKTGKEFHQKLDIHLLLGLGASRETQKQPRIFTKTVFLKSEIDFGE